MSSPQLAVDIVIDNYNYGRFLGEAIESALAQTHPRVDVIVVDDGSTDDSREVLASYEGRVTAVTKENGGHASAFNEGVRNCQGDIVIFLDADDVLKRDAAASAAAAFAADRRVVKVQSRMEVVDEGGNPTGSVKPPQHLAMPNGDVRESELLSPFDLQWVPTSANAFRTEAVRRLLPIPEDDYRMCAERYLVHLISLLGPVVSLDDVNALYRVHGGNAYETRSPRLDLDRLRLTIRVDRATSRGLLDLAGQIGIQSPQRILSLADLANRMISLRLEPEQHPVPDDSRLSLLGDSARAAMRRPHVAAPMKILFVAWFGAMALAPRPLARRLAAAFLFPERRGSINRLLGVFQRSAGRAPAETR